MQSRRFCPSASVTLAVLVFLLSAVVEGSAKQRLFESWKRVGFVSMGNYRMVHHLVPNATPVIIKHVEELESAVRNGTIDAALISGVPDDTEFDIYNSGSISPRGMMTRQGDTFSRQLADALIVRLLMTGNLFNYAAKNAPFDFVEVHTCRSTDVDIHLPFPQQAAGMMLNSSTSASLPTTLKVGALGPYNWAQDGDYTVSPPTGFWPDVFEGLRAVLASSSSFANFTLERKYYKSSVSVMDALANGDVHFTEPYWTIDSFYQNRPRTWSFDEGCLVLGYESTFFTKKPAAAASTDGLGSGIIALIVLAAVAVALLSVVLLFLVLFRGKKEEEKSLSGDRGAECEEIPARSEVEHQHEPTA